MQGGSVRFYIGFDDTDFPGSDVGTGKLARRFPETLPPGCTLWGVVRQQLLVDRAIPYTSHNSAACVVVHGPDLSILRELLALAVEHIEREALRDSDPGLCVVAGNDPALTDLGVFGQACTSRIVTQDEARKAAGPAHLSGHGGTCDGIIGAAAAVGLTASGWAGRFIEYADLRSLPERPTVAALEQKGIRVVSLDRDAFCPRRDDVVFTKGWLRPRLWGNEAVLPVKPLGPGLWESMGEKRNKKTSQD